jgi:hypothetical protein
MLAFWSIEVVLAARLSRFETDPFRFLGSKKLRRSNICIAWMTMKRVSMTSSKIDCLLLPSMTDSVTFLQLSELQYTCGYQTFASQSPRVECSHFAVLDWNKPSHKDCIPILQPLFPSATLVVYSVDSLSSKPHQNRAVTRRSCLFNLAQF